MSTANPPTTTTPKVRRSPTRPPWEAPTTLTPAPVDPVDPADPEAAAPVPVAEAWELAAEAPRVPLVETLADPEEAAAAAEVVATAIPSEEDGK